MHSVFIIISQLSQIRRDVANAARASRCFELGLLGPALHRDSLDLDSASCPISATA
jgi:hypothetical protein